MARFVMYEIPIAQLSSTDLRKEASKNAGNPTLEAYSVVIDGEAQRAEVLYFGDRDIAGVAWGADANWLEHVDSAEQACQQEFDEIT